MKFFFEQWKRILEEKRPNDYHFIVYRGPRDIQIKIIDKETGKSPEGKLNQHGESTGIAQMKLQKRDDNDYWEVASVSAPKGSSGVGKELYLLALELSSGGLSPDSITISPAAADIWNNYIKKHPLVSLEEKETETDADENDPFKYIFHISPKFESNLDIEYKRIEQKDPPEVEKAREPAPFDPEIDIEDYLEDIYEDFQQNVKKNYSKLKFKMIGQGKNKYNVGGKMKKPSYKRSKAAPPGFGGSLE